MSVVTHSNLTLTASLVGDHIAVHVGDTFIDGRSLAPTRQWQRIVQMLLDAPLEVRRDLLDALDADADAGPEQCAHESREENGGWAWCPDCRHGWPVEPSRAED